MKWVLFARYQQEEADPNRSPKKQLGDTNFYCPVSLTEKNVLLPGDPECSAKFREKIYYFVDEVAREKFLASPEAFLPKDSPPVVSVLIGIFSFLFVYMLIDWFTLCPKKCYYFVSLCLWRAWIDFDNFWHICYGESRQSQGILFSHLTHKRTATFYET